jgi:hypothetical protein
MFTEGRQCGADMEGAEFQDDIQKRKEFGESKDKEDSTGYGATR